MKCSRCKIEEGKMLDVDYNVRAKEEQHILATGSTVLCLDCFADIARVITMEWGNERTDK